MTDQRITVVRVRTDYGTRHGLQVATGRKFHSFIFPSTDRLTVTRIRIDDAVVTELEDYMSPSKAIKAIIRMARRNGITKSAAKHLGIRATNGRRART